MIVNIPYIPTIQSKAYENLDENLPLEEIEYLVRLYTFEVADIEYQLEERKYSFNLTRLRLSEDEKLVSTITNEYYDWCRKAFAKLRSTSAKLFVLQEALIRNEEK